MILSKPFDNNKIVEFKTLTGEVSIPTVGSEKICGNYQKVGNFDVAIYFKDNSLILQIGLDTWNLSSPNNR